MGKTTVTAALNELRQLDGLMRVRVKCASGREGLNMEKETTAVDAVNILSQFEGATELTDFSCEVQGLDKPASGKPAAAAKLRPSRRKKK